MEVTYSSTRSDQWRCNWYMASHRPQLIFSLLLLPLLVGLLHTWLLLPSFGKLGEWAFASALVFSLCLSVLPHILIIHIQVVKRLPTRASRRICTTSISLELFRDVMPEKAQEYRWTEITAIRLHQGDFYFWIGGTKGNFIPRSAFDDRRDAQQFFDLAQSYWQSAKTGVEIPVSQDVWPPVPRPGA